MIKNSPEDLYDDLVDKIGELLFGTPQAHMAYPYRTLVDAWLRQNRMGLEDIRKYFKMSSTTSKETRE